MLLITRYFGIGKETAAAGLFALADKTNDPHVKRFAALYGGVVYRDQHLTKDEVAELKHIITLIKKQGRLQRSS